MVADDHGWREEKMREVEKSWLQFMYHEGLL
jgi:hypothetical protein